MIMPVYIATSISQNKKGIDFIVIFFLTFGGSWYCNIDML